jgi:hypothetical protein
MRMGAMPAGLESFGQRPQLSLVGDGESDGVGAVWKVAGR